MTHTTSAAGTYPASLDSRSFTKLRKRQPAIFKLTSIIVRQSVVSCLVCRSRKVRLQHPLATCNLTAHIYRSNVIGPFRAVRNARPWVSIAPDIAHFPKPRRGWRRITSRACTVPRASRNEESARVKHVKGPKAAVIRFDQPAHDVYRKVSFVGIHRNRGAVQLPNQTYQKRALKMGGWQLMSPLVQPLSPSPHRLR
jgi:hypothetical protein